MSLEKRVFVGNLNNSIDECLEELYTRFQKFGTCKDDKFEKFTNFAYLNMEFENEAKFGQLKKMFNNSNFKSNIVKIDVAKPSWKEQWKLDQLKDLKQEEKITKFNLRKNWEHYKKMENLKMSWSDRMEVIPGRMRRVPRSKVGLRNITFRVLTEDGSLKVYKCYKDKLWGYERNKEVNDLVYKFVTGKWRNGYNHIVDRLDYSRVKKTVGLSLRNEEDDTKLNVTADFDIDDEEELEKQLEKETVNNALSEVLHGFDFDKPMSVFDSDDDIEIPKEDNHKKPINQNHEMKEQAEYDEVSRTEKLETVSGPEQSKNIKDTEQSENEDSSEEEFIPTFSAAPVVSEGTISNTDTLRSLFNPEVQQNSTYKLIGGDDDDINEDNREDENNDEDITANQPIITSIAEEENADKLFFPHFSSPFLVGQTRLSNITTNSVKTTLKDWEKEFWNNRGVWMREMKQKKRDAFRQQRKRQRKNGTDFLI